MGNIGVLDVIILVVAVFLVGAGALALVNYFRKKSSK